MKPIKHIIFDFDGTCTQIPVVYEAFSEAYRENFSTQVQKLDPAYQVSGADLCAVTKEEWAAAEDAVRSRSPAEGWSVGTTPSAPIASDPYIFADETAKLICRQRKIKLPATVALHSDVYKKASAPWRNETLQVLKTITDKGIKIHFVSNSSSEYVTGRLDKLLEGDPNTRANVDVFSDAGKFLIKEPDWGTEGDLPGDLRERFDEVPVSESACPYFARPTYLRRGRYYEALCRALGNDLSAFEKTLVCGDVWELDLSLPCQLGMQLHLIHREAPFDTYPYEFGRIRQCGAQAGHSKDLTGLLARL
ncbi:FMN phosphatase YigB (HAD superfamily) [Haloferula luteola]|uniref:FMN phosphatase YigB (HAD superfamily) n=1 Tax=Haloferula luteola TaxID=595692 RepID=A0A840V0U8_9BACT|nr:HAD family hydrolase [Haloferula luteola]MBB5351622.1 FMN phosphatase YigB (HAD superfamily) [Haloferula luteola]